MTTAIFSTIVLGGFFLFLGWLCILIYFFPPKSRQCVLQEQDEKERS